MRSATLSLAALLIITGCTSTQPSTPMPDIPATVDAAIQAALRALTPEPTSASWTDDQARGVSNIINQARLQLGSRIGTASTFLRNTEPAGYDRPPEQVFRTMLQPLIARHLGLNSQQEVEDFSFPDDRVRLFVYATLPEQLQVRYAVDEDAPITGRQQGRVLYCIDLFDPEEP